MKLIKFFLEKIGPGDDVCAFLPESTKAGQTVVIKKYDPDYSGAYRVCEKASIYSEEAIIVNQEDII
jgi:hypothetical protein